MPRSKQLNNLALKAKFGCKASLWEFRSVFIDKIHEMSNKNWYRIHSEERFEESCFSRIDYVVRTFSPEKGDVYKLVMWNLRELLKQHRKRFSARPKVLSMSNTVGESGAELGTQIIDDSASAIIDDKLMVNEKIALIAKGDPRKEMILKLWACGIDETKHIARVLAKNCGGNISSHRIYTHRFRARCRKALA